MSIQEEEWSSGPPPARWRCTNSGSARSLSEPLESLPFVRIVWRLNVICCRDQQVWMNFTPDDSWCRWHFSESFKSSSGSAHSVLCRRFWFVNTLRETFVLCHVSQHTSRVKTGNVWNYWTLQVPHMNVFSESEVCQPVRLTYWLTDMIRHRNCFRWYQTVGLCLIKMWLFFPQSCNCFHFIN